jgi:hypothetical protein
MKTLLGTDNPVSFAGGSYYEVTNLRMLPPLPRELFPEIPDLRLVPQHASDAGPQLTAVLAHRRATAFEGTARRAGPWRRVHTAQPRLPGCATRILPQAARGSSWMPPPAPPWTPSSRLDRRAPPRPIALVGAVSKDVLCGSHLPLASTLRTTDGGPALRRPAGHGSP